MTFHLKSPHILSYIDLNAKMSLSLTFCVVLILHFISWKNEWNIIYFLQFWLSSLVYLPWYPFVSSVIFFFFWWGVGSYTVQHAESYFLTRNQTLPLFWEYDKGSPFHNIFNWTLICQLPLPTLSFFYLNYLKILKITTSVVSFGTLKFIL